MCRLLLTVSTTEIPTATIQQYIWSEQHAMIKQCYKLPYTPNDTDNPRNHHINLDGYGIGFYNDNNNPHIFTNTGQPWNDNNLQQLVPLIRTKLLIVHIRAINNPEVSSQQTKPVHQFNCHPFSYQDYMFCHNGTIEIFSTGKYRKKIINRIDDSLITEIKGTTDSEYLFYLILTYTLEGLDIVNSVTKALRYINRLNKHAVITANLVLTNNKDIVVTRYINRVSEQPPSLYCQQTDNKLVIASEPLTKEDSTWSLVDRNTMLHIADGTKTVIPL